MANLFFEFPRDVKQLIFNNVIEMLPISIICIRLTCKDWDFVMKKKTLETCCKTHKQAVSGLFENVPPVNQEEFLMLFLKSSKITTFPTLTNVVSTKQLILSLASSHDILLQTKKQCNINFALEDILQHGNFMILKHYKDLIRMNYAYKILLLQGIHSFSTIEWIFEEIISDEFLNIHWRKLQYHIDNDGDLDLKSRYILDNFNMPSEFHESLLICYLQHRKMESFLKLQKQTNCKSYQICRIAHRMDCHLSMHRVCYCFFNSSKESEQKKIKI